MATFSDIYTRIEREVLKQTATVYLTDVKNAIVSAIRYYEHKPVWFTQVVGANLTITAGSDNVSLPSDFATMESLRVYDGTRYYDDQSGFEPIEFKKLRSAKNANPNFTGTPTLWADWAGKIYVDSTVASNTTLPIDYYRKDTSYPSGASDTSLWFEEGQDVIRWMATSIFYGDRLHDSENEAKFFAKAESAFENLDARSNMRRRSYRMP